MNSQTNYIVHATIVLSFCAGFFYFINKLPTDSVSKEENTGYCGTTSDMPVFLSDSAEAGKVIFTTTCASCHTLFKDATGSSLAGFTKRGPWTWRQNVYDWVHNPPAFMVRNEYALKLKETHNGVIMTSFPGMSTEAIDAICAYLTEIDKQPGNSD